MIKLSKKNLEELAKSLDAFKVASNVYNYENTCYYIQHFDFKEYQKELDKELISKIKKYIKINNYENYIQIKNIAYSCGIYGNTGLLSQVNIYKNNKIVNVFYIYY